MKNYALEVEKLSDELTEQIIKLYDKVVVKRGQRQVQMGTYPPQPHTYEIPLKFNTKLEGYFTKVNGLGYDSHFNTSSRAFFLKGFQVGRLKYRMKPIKNLSVEERQIVLDELIKQYNL